MQAMGVAPARCLPRAGKPQRGKRSRGPRHRRLPPSAPAEDFDRIADLVDAHPEVAHNHTRDHAQNIWFVLAPPAPQGIGETCARIEAETGLTVLQFPKLEEFFIGFRAAA